MSAGWAWEAMAPMASKRCSPSKWRRHHRRPRLLSRQVINRGRPALDKIYRRAAPWAFLIGPVVPGPLAINTANRTMPGVVQPTAQASRSSQQLKRLFAHLRLQIILQAYFLDQFHLGFEPVDMLFGVVQDVLEQIAGDEIAHRLAIGHGLFDGDLRSGFQLVVTRQDFRHVLADHELVQILQVGQAVQHENTLYQAICVFHFADGFVVLVLAKLGQTPVIQHARMQEVLVNGGKLVLELRIQMLNYGCVAFHGHTPEAKSVVRLPWRHRKWLGNSEGTARPAAIATAENRYQKLQARRTATSTMEVATMRGSLAASHTNAPASC